MPNINNINISDAEFTAMQELATAFICKRAFKDNKKFNSPEDIIKDKVTKKGLEDIFTYQRKPLLKFSLPIQDKTVEDKWLNTFYLQQKRLLTEFSDAKFTVFNREGGFMQFITDLIKDKFGISRKDSWDPADIWLIKDSPKFRNKIAKELEGPRGTQTIRELNAIMRTMFKNREIVGVSLKLISGKTARYEEVNVSDEFYKKLENMQGEYDFKVSRIVCKLNLRDKNQFATQDTNIFLKDTSKEIAKFQLKGNTTSRLANLKFEGTEIGASAARLGKAPLNLVEKLSNMVDKDLYNNETKQNGNYPTTAAEYQKVKGNYEKMFEILLKSSLVKDLGIKTKKEFSNNMIKVFNGPTPWIANVKLMQVYYVQRLLSLKEKDRNEYLTDLLFLSQKKGNKVFDFGPFGKLY
jgi:hypothetical protein|tara:strand:+ start:192 stop:1418 length:1227 start_codon:yes stop_codon:yes gene_type:complete